MTPRLLSATSIEGTTVRNTDGEKIGEIKDLMINLQNGDVAYAVLSFGGFLGFGEKLFAIPMESIDFDGENEEAVLTHNVDKEQLENAPGFDKDNWPQHADNTFIDSVYSHYGYGSYSDRNRNRSQHGDNDRNTGHGEFDEGIGRSEETSGRQGIGQRHTERSI